MNQRCLFRACIGATTHLACVVGAISLLLAVSIAGCSSKQGSAETANSTQVVHEGDASIVQVDHPEHFPLVAATANAATSELAVTGVVNPDISKTVPVISLVSGRVVDVRARLGDTVHKGQVLLRVRSDDVSGGYSDYRKAVADELLARKQLDRAKDLFAHGAIAQGELDSAQDAEDDAKVNLETTTEHLRLLGNDPDHPSGIVDIVAPVAGVITDQEVTVGSSVQSYSANPFTISDLSDVWIVCDVYENDLPNVRLGESVELRLNAYPAQPLKGRISNIGTILDPNVRTAKVRIEVSNPGMIRVGMFVTATFHGLTKEIRAAVPAAAILHLHDRDWVFVSAGGNKFCGTEVVGGKTLPNNMQEIVSGLKPGDQVVANALELQNTVEQ
jgi:membrane fusion protein, heavy metal efflux system